MAQCRQHLRAPGDTRSAPPDARKLRRMQRSTPDSGDGMRMGHVGRIICISNQKGGVGKTTTAINLAASLASAERRTLLVDMDPQGNAGSGLGLKRDALNGTIYEALLNGRPMKE